MTCNDFLKGYSAYRDSTDPALTAAMQVHLAGCATCRAHDVAVRRGVEALRRQVLTPSADFNRRLEARLSEWPSDDRMRQLHRIRPMMATAVAALLLALVILSSRRAAMVSTAAAEADPPSVARPVALGGIPFVAFVPGP